MGNDLELGLYVKGDRVRVANSQKEAVQAVWDGFARPAPEGEVSFADLKAQAKALGIKTNQKKADLQQAIASFEPPVEESTPDGTENADPETPDEDA